MRRSAFIRGRTLQTRFRWRCAISAPSSAPIDLLQQRDLWQPPPSSVAPISDLPALTPERGSSTVSGNSARRYKIQTPVTPGLFRVPVRKRARQAVTAFGDDEAGGPEHRTFDLALDQKRDYRTLSSNTGKRRWCLANPPFVDRGGGLRPRPSVGGHERCSSPGLSTPACRRTTPLQRLIERDLGRQRGGVARDRQRERRPTLRL